MNTCSRCGAPLSRLDPACSFCRAPNQAHEALSPEVAGLVARGQQAFKERRPGDALKFLTKALEIEPETFDAYFSLAAAWQALGKLDRALDALERARRIRPGNAPLHYNISTLTAQLGPAHRHRARQHLWEAFRLLGRDPDLLNKKGFVFTLYGALERLGPITGDEIEQLLPATRDAEGHPTNAELAACIEEARSNRSKGLIFRVYVAVLRSFLLVPNDGTGARDGVLRMLPHGSQLRAVTVTGPDGKQWLPAFTDAGALRAFKPGAYIACSAFPGVSIAQMVLANSRTEGLVLNTRADGGGQPLERTGLEAIAKGHVVRLEF